MEKGKEITSSIGAGRENGIDGGNNGGGKKSYNPQR